jgi:hypothetical protein
MREAHGGFSKDDVQQAERMAWTSHDGRDFHFDGTYFWLSENGNNWAVTAQAVPHDGWRHRDGCNCPLCRSVATHDALNTEWLAQNSEEMSRQ